MTWSGVLRLFTCVAAGSEASRAAAGTLLTGGVVSWTGCFSGVTVGTEEPSGGLSFVVTAEWK